MLSIILIIIAVTILIVRYHWQRQRLYKMMAKFDGPKTIPILGNAHVCFQGSPTDIFFKGRQIASNFPQRKPYRFWLFSKPYIVLRDPDDIRIAANTPRKDDFYRFMADLSGNGILTSNGIRWRQSRAVIEPALNTSLLSEYFLGIFNRHCDELVKSLKDQQGKTIDLFHSVFKAEIASIYETVVGYYDESSEELVSYFHDYDITGLIAKRAYIPWLQPSFIFKAYLYMTGKGDLFNKVRNHFLRAVLKRKKSLKEWKASNQNEYETGAGIIDILLDSHFKDKNIVDETITLLMAGTDTSGIALCFTLLMLAMNPDIQDEVHRELQKIFGHSDYAPTASDLSKMIFLEQCLKESLRLFSIVPGIFRRITVDTVLKGHQSIRLKTVSKYDYDLIGCLT